MAALATTSRNLFAEEIILHLRQVFPQQMQLMEILKVCRFELGAEFIKFENSIATALATQNNSALCAAIERFSKLIAALAMRLKNKYKQLKASHNTMAVIPKVVPMQLVTPNNAEHKPESNAELVRKQLAVRESLKLQRKRQPHSIFHRNKQPANDSMDNNIEFNLKQQQVLRSMQSEKQRLEYIIALITEYLLQLNYAEILRLREQKRLQQKMLETKL